MDQLWTAVRRILAQQDIGRHKKQSLSLKMQHSRHTLVFILGK